MQAHNIALVGSILILFPIVAFVFHRIYRVLLNSNSDSLVSNHFYKVMFTISALAMLASGGVFQGLLFLFESDFSLLAIWIGLAVLSIMTFLGLYFTWKGVSD